jgi:preprotein translocase subunit SecF
MRKTILLAAMLSLTVLMFAASPAIAQDWNDGWWNDDWNNDWNEGWWNDGFDFDGGLNQDVEQEAESGDVDQSFDVSGTGDNSNQTVGTQGVANTGNAQNATGILQLGGDADDFEFDEVGSSIEVSPSSTTDSEQRVNQSASASD